MKIFCLPWHCAHIYELVKLPYEFGMMVNSRRVWAYNSRPIPGNVELVPYYEPGKYDLAILNVDQQCAHPDIGKGILYRELNELIQDIPKIVINHGSPVWPEWFAKDKIVKKIKEIIGANQMVVNSYRAAEEWGWGRPIIHGLDPDEWFDLPKEARIVTAVSPAGLDTYYNRELFRQTCDILKHQGIKIIEFRMDIVFKDWKEYRDFLGRSLIYLDYSKDTPLNRARTEAMLSGCCVVTVAGHDTERFIKDGENAMLVKNNPNHVAQVLGELIADYDRCVRIGQAGKEMAKEYFSKEQYQNNWIQLINETIEKK